MKLLLTSGGVTTARIQAELTAMLGKPIAEATALCIPTAAYGHPDVGPDGVWRFIAGQAASPMVNLGWRSVGVLELTALPSIDAARWQQWVRDADVLLVDGGDAVFLSYWLKRSGMADFILTQPDLVWVGVSAGSMVMAPRIGQFFVQWQPENVATDAGLGLVGFGIFPHLNLFPENNLANARQWQHAIGTPGYVLDEQSALAVDARGLRVISDGEWHYLK